MVKTSVIIPVFNDKENLEKCLGSIFRTSYGDFEVNVVDDNSQDSPESLRSSYPKVNFIKLSSNRGPAYARNKGIESSCGSIIIFTDADCVLPPDFVRDFSFKLEELIQEDKSVAALCCKLISGKSFFEMAHSYAGYAYIQNGEKKKIDYLNTACTAVLRQAVINVGGLSEDMRVSEDPELALKLKEKGYKIFFTPDLEVFHNHQVDTFGKLLKKHYLWGRLLGVKLELKHPGYSGVPRAFLLNPIINFALILPAAFFTTLKILMYNYRYDDKVIFYALHIFLAKIYFRLGIFLNIWQGADA